MHLVRRLCLLVAIISLAGCAETKYRGDAMPPVASNQARIVFFRNSSFVGADLQTGILYDGGVIGNSRPGTYFYIDTTPGTHDISTTGDVNSHLSFALGAGETKYVKTALGLGQFAGRIEPELVGANRAQKELPELTFAPTGPIYVPGKPATTTPDPTPDPVPYSAPPPAPEPQTAVPAREAAPTVESPAVTAAPAAAGPAASRDRYARLRLGTSSNSVEELARRARQCDAVYGAELVSSDGPVELYREQCRDGRVFQAKCEFHQCVEIDPN